AFFFLSLIPVRGAAEPASMSAVYAGHGVSLTIPYEAARNGEAELTADILSPEDEVLGTTSRTMNVAQGSAVWSERVALAQSMTLDEVIWQRVRFTLRYTGDKRPNLVEIRS